MGGVVRILKTLLTASVIAVPAACLAGPFCVAVTGLKQDCKYYDETSCAHVAVERGGACIDKSTGFSVGANKAARYCLVGSGDAKCYYYDAASCAKAVLDFGGTCVERHR
jgi:hypothetical protein